ncbi:hypothetical protein EB118_16755 [bacterium]|nr:hypothetical protein [Actinomycetota bacterium]NDG31706.1 hypothetical protein [bacterium]
MSQNVIIKVGEHPINLIELETLLEEEKFPPIITVVKNNVKLVFIQLYDSAYSVSRTVFRLDNAGLPRSDASVGLLAKEIIGEILHM